MMQQGFKHLMNSKKIKIPEFVQDDHLKAIIIVFIKHMFGQEGFDGVQRDGKCFGIECSINLLLDQFSTLIHSHPAPTISNKVEMHTKVNHSS
jgi:hypothetical protein